MAKGQYKKWLEPENLLLLQGWKRDGLTDEQIAKNIGVRRETLYAWINKYPNIANALKMGKEQANFIIENALFKKAKSGHVTAQIFWLKNNWRDKYNDSQLSVEERDLAKQRAGKMDIDTKNAEAELEIKRAKLKILQSEGVNAEDHLLKLIETIEREDDKENGT